MENTGDISRRIGYALEVLQPDLANALTRTASPYTSTARRISMQLWP